LLAPDFLQKFNSWNNIEMYNLWSSVYWSLGNSYKS